MKNWYKFIIVILSSLCSHASDAQTKCTVPDSPVLTSVSIQPETGITDLNWTLSPSSDIAAYILYSYKNGDGIPIDTIWEPGVTSYSYNSTASKYPGQSYVVSALRLPDCESQLSNSINAIFCSPGIDTCRQEISVRWNLYTDFPRHVLKYETFVTRNDTLLPEIYSVNSQTDSLIFTDFETDSRYCFVVKAVLEGGGVSVSNKSCLTIKMQRAPQWINSDYATVTPENKISLSYTIDPLSQVTRFRLERKTGSSGSFQQIAELASEDGHIIYTDNQADINAVNFYRLSAINNCNIPVIYSNLSSNIVLSLNRKGNDINLSWNSYRSWSGVLSAYKLLIKTGEEYREMTLLQSHDTSLTIAYSEIMYQVTGSDVCFRIIAAEAGNPFGKDGESISSGQCTSITEIITVPNLFTPDGDLVNDLFKPVLSFNPENYHLVISDIKGKVVFETRSESDAWDGSIKGDQLPQGVYLWFLKATGPSGQMFSKTGTITIVRHR